MRQQLASLAMLATLTACGGGNQAVSDSATSPAAVLQVQAMPSAIETATTASPVAAKAVDLTDAIAILKMIVGLDVNSGGAALTAYQAYAADVDGNGKVELSDAISVLKRIVGLEAATANWMFFNGTPTVADKLNPGIPASVSAAVSSTSEVSMKAVLRGDVVSSSTFTYSWALTSKPTGSTAALANTTAASPSFKADVAGSYVATMTITDGSSNVATSSVTLTACNSSNTSSPFSGCTGSGGSSSSGFSQTYTASAAAGEVFSYTVDTTNLTYSYTITQSAYGCNISSAACHTGSGTLTKNSDGSYTPSGSPSSKIHALPNGLVVGSILMNLNGTSVRVPFIGVSNPITTASEIAGTYNFMSLQCNGIAYLSCNTLQGTATLDSSGTTRLVLGIIYLIQAIFVQT